MSKAQEFLILITPTSHQPDQSYAAILWYLVRHVSFQISPVLECKSVYSLSSQLFDLIYLIAGKCDHKDGFPFFWHLS